MNSSLSGLLALYTSIILLGLNGLFAKLIPLDAITITQLRSCIAFVALVLLLKIQRQSLGLGSFRVLMGVLCLGALLGLHWVTYFKAMQTATVAVGMLALFSYPVVTVIIEPFFKWYCSTPKGESAERGRAQVNPSQINISQTSRYWPSTRDILAALLVFVGIALMVVDDVSAFFVPPESGEGGVDTSFMLQGALWGVLSAVLFAFRNTAQKYFYADISSAKLMLYQVLAIAVMLSPFSSMEDGVNMPQKGWLNILALGVISTAAAHTFLSLSLKRLPAKSVAMISCLTPLVGGTLAWLFLGEVPSFTIFAGGALILAVACYESVQHSAS